MDLLLILACLVAAVPIALVGLWLLDRLFGEDLPNDTYYDFCQEQLERKDE
jgi:hypothetical protein